MKDSQPAKKKTGVTRKLLSYLKGSKYIILAALVMAVIGAVLTIIGPNQIGKLTHFMSAGLMTTIDMNGIARVVILLITIYALSALFSYLQTYIMATVTLKSSKQMRKDISEKINKVPQKYFNTVSQGDILSRVTNDVSTLQQTLSNSLPNIISAVAQFIGCLIMMFVTEWRLAICVVGITVIGVLLLVVIAGRSQRFFVKRQICVGEINGFVEEMYSGHDVVRLSRAEKNITKNFDQLNEDLYNANWKSQFLSGVMQPVMSAVGNMSYVAVCVIGAMLAMDNVISFGIIVSFIMYARLFSSPLTTIAQGMTNLQTATAASNRIFEFLEAEELEDESHKTAHIVDPKGNVTFDHVRFAYPTTPDKIIIKDFSATAKAGQKIAIVGPTGAGKSTLVNLLMRFFEVNSGSISIDGIPIQDMKREDVHALFSMVLQDTWLFDGTIRENLVYNMKNLTDADLDRVCKSCSLEHFIRSLPNGYDTVLAENTEVSSGQKQLLTIARAMLQDSPMLILDEATSSVDTRTEAMIQKAMDELMKNRTSFVIAHRLSTIKNADLILVMKDGDVIEKGNHEELMAAGGFYANLYNSQFDSKTA